MIAVQRAEPVSVLRERALPKLIVLDADCNVTACEPGALELMQRFCPAAPDNVPQIPEIVKRTLKQAIGSCSETSGDVTVLTVPVPNLVVRATRLNGSGTQCIAVTVEEMATREHLRSAPARFKLSDRELAVLSMLIHGNSARNIALALCISQNTVKEHVKRVYVKLGVNTRAQAIARVLDWRP